MAGLALAQSIVAFVEVAILFAVIVVRDRKLLDQNFLSGIVKIISVTGFSVVAAYTMISFLPLTLSDTGFFTLGTKFAAIAGVTAIVHVVISGIFGLEETRPIFTWVKRIVFRPVKV